MGRRLGRKGFTLFELTITAGVLGILAMIAIPNYLGMLKKARQRILLQSCFDAKTQVHQWLLAAVNYEAQTVDFNCDGLLTQEDDALRPGSVERVTGDWETIHGDGQPCAAYSPYDASLPLFNRFAGSGSGQISVNCDGHGCRVRGFNADPREPPIYDEIVAVD